MKNAERRKHPRIKDNDISVQLSSGDGFDTITQSLDVSASGIYCKVSKRIPLMTRVQLMLVLPGKHGSAPTNLEIDGVVVREHAVLKEGVVQHYDVAIFFNTLMPKERKLLADYIDSKVK